MHHAAMRGMNPGVNCPDVLLAPVTKFGISQKMATKPKIETRSPVQKFAVVMVSCFIAHPP